MGIRTGHHIAPLSAALLLALAACAQPTAAPADAAPSPAPIGTAPSSVSVPASARATSAALPGTTEPSSAQSSPAVPSTAQPVTPDSTTAGDTAPVTSGAGEPVVPLPSCNSATLPTSVRGTLTFAVDRAAGAPWFIGNPAEGQGFEAAVGAAVARQLGYAADQVAWKTGAAAEVRAAKVPGADVGLGEFRTPDEGGGPVDYSTGYFSISDSVVARVGTPAAKVTGLPALGKLRVASSANAGAGAAGLHSPSNTAYPTTAAALAALRRGAVDVAVLPTPVAVTAGTDIAVLGQLSLPTEQPAQFGMVLAKNSRLTSCISAAVDQLRVTGTLAALVQRWVPAANKPLK